MSGRVKVNVSFKALCWQVFSSASLPKLMAGGRDGVSTVGLLSLFLGWGIEKGVEQRMQKIWSSITLSIFRPPHVVKLKSRPKLDRSPSVRPTLIRSLIATLFYQGLINTQWVRANPMCTLLSALFLLCASLDYFPITSFFYALCTFKIVPWFLSTSYVYCN